MKMYALFTVSSWSDESTELRLVAVTAYKSTAEIWARIDRMNSYQEVAVVNTVNQAQAL